MTKQEILKVLNSNVRRLRRELKAARRHERERIILRLEEAERIRDAVRCQDQRDKRTEDLEKLL